MTCIGNSGPLDEVVSSAIEEVGLLQFDYVYGWFISLIGDRYHPFVIVHSLPSIRHCPFVIVRSITCRETWWQWVFFQETGILRVASTLRPGLITWPLLYL